ncbi:STAS domain-containing protein [Amycolatopsis acidicola]|uniref:STAS domain-containing protein n=1 Tax=Amycolatopsis acidicola TaxID=2596893 RepID=A0A5N0VMB7_9PSEU|nr:STAS domain-containing protein [Amycolatopsis acidicola]KAA9166320.1 STAS domain-containing protein [Amycolatopsis acidicola]
MTAARFSHPLTMFPGQRGGEPLCPHRLRLSVRRPRPDTAVVTAAGELSRDTAPRLTELLTSRLRSALCRVVLDLSEVDILDADGASAISLARLLARHRGIVLDVVPPVPVAAAPPQRKQDR